jgi:hypothetical protein
VRSPESEGCRGQRGTYTARDAADRKPRQPGKVTGRLAEPEALVGREDLGPPSSAGFNMECEIGRLGVFGNLSPLDGRGRRLFTGRDQTFRDWFVREHTRGPP